MWARRCLVIFCLSLSLFGRGANAQSDSPTGKGAGRLNLASQPRCSYPADSVVSDPLVTSALPASKEFIAARHFRESISAASEVRISWLGASFVRRFVVKIERDAPTEAFRVYELGRPSLSSEIAEDLKPPFETSLADIWCLLKLQPGGEAGVLRTGLAPNLFYVRDAIGEIGVIDVIWSGAGWDIGASAMTNDRRWTSGVRVISR